LLEQTVNLKIEETYLKLKHVLTAKGCKIISEEPPKQISLKQGSLWGISPQSAKKEIIVKLEHVGDATWVNCSSKLASDWKNITLIGCSFAFVLVSLCAWIAIDLTAFIATREPSFWSWLVAVGDNVDLVIAQTFVNLVRGLALFLSVIILLEILIVVYVRSKIDAFTKETLNQLI
jgi:hypothetical protein